MSGAVWPVTLTLLGLATIVCVHVVYAYVACQQDVRLNIEHAFAGNATRQFIEAMLAREAYPSNDTALSVRSKTHGKMVLESNETTRVGSLAQANGVSIVSFSTVRLQGEIDAPYVFGRSIHTTDCQTINVEELAALDTLDIEAQDVTVRNLQSNGRAIISAAHLQATEITSPSLFFGVYSPVGTARRGPRVVALPGSGRAAARAADKAAAACPTIAAGTVISGPAVFHSDLHIGEGVTLLSRLKVYGNLSMDDSVTIIGDVVVNGRLRAGRNCAFHANLIVKKDIALGEDSSFGDPDKAGAVVTGQRIALTAPFSLFGTVRSAVENELRVG